MIESDGCVRSRAGTLYFYRTAKRIVILVIGLTVCAIGLTLIVLPGPAVVVVPIGLAILATEFAWARHWLRRYKSASMSVWTVFTARFRRSHTLVMNPPERTTSVDSRNDSEKS